MQMVKTSMHKTKDSLFKKVHSEGYIILLRGRIKKNKTKNETVTEKAPVVLQFCSLLLYHSFTAQNNKEQNYRPTTALALKEANIPALIH